MSSLQFNIIRSMGMAIGLLMLTSPGMPQPQFRGTYLGDSQQDAGYGVQIAKKMIARATGPDFEVGSP